MRLPPRYAVPLLALSLTLVAGCGGSKASPKAVAAGSVTSTTTSSPPTTTAATTSTTTKASTPKATRTVAAGPSTSATRRTASASPTRRATSAPKSMTSLAPVPRAGAEPAVRFPTHEPAVGTGANATVGAVPDSEWSRMVGWSWTQGCPVGRSQLRWVRVNFWGFDGKRSRGSLVVNASIADEAAAAFTSLYEQHFRIRQMKPMDSRWGHNPKGPGADDYAAMEADNTSAFNCRYVGGEEASKVYSKHAYGTAIDVNDFENPYVADNGTVYPDRYWLTRRGPAPGVFSSSGSAAVRAFTSQGLRWGGLWSNPDLQHFDR